METWKHTCSNGRTVVVLTTKDKQGNYRGEYASNVGRPNDGSCGGRGGIQETVNSSKNDKAEVSDPAVRDHSNILALINHYRNIHGANNVEWDANCQYAAYEAARDICEKNGGNLDHKVNINKTTHYNTSLSPHRIGLIVNIPIVEHQDFSEE